MNCFDCHNQTSTTPIGGLTLRTVVAHGGAQTIRGTATTSGTTLSATNGVKLCIVCHTGTTLIRQRTMPAVPRLPPAPTAV
ncbi:hypothetical protein [Geotalea toluenoxydans]|uniref:hypothetical protein n=1 Tax=Geotalea toluenoxydans TaxID=421624 RepID=UPI001FB2CE50|nr:hypothetical protein [Geotalea toluenoxydans]